VQGVLFGKAQELGVGRGAPEEVGQTGGEFEVVEPARSFPWVGFGEIEEAGEARITLSGSRRARSWSSPL